VLNSGKAEAPAFDLSVDIRTPLKEQFEISQVLPNLPESTEGKQLTPGALTVRARGYKTGSGTSGSIPLAKGEQSLYISSPGGEADHFLITYTLVDPEKQNAGTYRTEVQYFLSTQGGQKLLVTFPMEITIGRIFDLIVTPQQPSGIQFQDVQLGQRPRSSEILVEIKSNVGRQYQVSQQLPVQLSSNGGASVPPRYFTLRLEDTGTKGLLKFPKPTEVKTGDMVLFISDKDGSPDKFKVIYEFSADASVPAGNYVGQIVYTISEL